MHLHTNKAKQGIKLCKATHILKKSRRDHFSGFLVTTRPHVPSEIYCMLIKAGLFYFHKSELHCIEGVLILTKASNPSLSE